MILQWGRFPFSLGCVDICQCPTAAQTPRSDTQSAQESTPQFPAKLIFYLKAQKFNQVHLGFGRKGSPRNSGLIPIYYEYEQTFLS